MRKSLRAVVIGSALTGGAIAVVVGCAFSAAAPAVPPAPTRMQLGQLAQAEERLVAGCMIAQGFPYVVPQITPPTGPATTFTFGNDDVAAAAKNGYGLGAASQPAADPNTEVFQRLSPSRQHAYEIALGGSGRRRVTVDVPGMGQVFTNTDGCRSDARRRLYGDLARWGRVHNLVTNLAPLAYLAVTHDPVFVSTLAKWRACMRVGGFSYADTGAAEDAAARLYDHLPKQDARRAETRIAVTDATCMRQTGLPAVGRRLQARHLAAVQAKYHDDIATYRTLVAHALAVVAENG
ncbi:hypothetical protein [Fodinicola acaciae]|uniref:hypothetical protein n=1 Tax=Fodinicola acaciae TaxID=2681555 RepID=UPI0013D1B62E|nr:hypothetical protein [Fodinicola acaciae]